MTADLTQTLSKTTYTTQIPVRRWGNGQAIRLSKEILEQMHIKENDNLNITIHDGKMVIEKVKKPKYLNLKERLEAFYDKPIDEIQVESTQEVDTGVPAGAEFW